MSDYFRVTLQETGGGCVCLLCKMSTRGAASYLHFVVYFPKPFLTAVVCSYFQVNYSFVHLHFHSISIEGNLRVSCIHFFCVTCR